MREGKEMVFSDIFMRHVIPDKLDKFECLNDPDQIIKYLRDNNSSIPKTIKRLMFKFNQPPTIKSDELWEYMFFIYFDIPAQTRLIDNNTLELSGITCVCGHLFDFPFPVPW